ncbi:MAG: copper-binding protein [Betaproteobacteria bacterium]|nr:copper-binding protein [Betaproteobacteria bacterium]
MKNVLPFALIAALGAGNAYAQQEPSGSNASQVQTPTSSVKTGTGTGLIQRIDKERGTVTIKHGPIPGLNMSAMTMSFPVKDKAMLAKLQPLQKVDFELSYDSKDYLITKIN